MNILSHIYIFYADVYFMQNFIIKIAVICLALYWNKLYLTISTTKGVGKVVLVAGIGTMIEITGLLLGNSYHLFLMLVHVLEIPFMIWFVLRKERKHRIKVIITGYFFVMVVNGVLEILWNWFGEQGNYVFYLCMACGGVYVGVHIWKNYTKMQKGIFPVEIVHKDKKISLYGFYDSGNQLTDPYTQKGVHILSSEIVSKLSVDVSKEVYIPYQALGNENGLIQVYYLEYIRIQKEETTVESEIVPVGIAEKTLFHNKRYQMILNGEIW